MSLGKVPMKAGGGARRNASVEQGTQVSMATQRAATTQGLRPSKVLGKGEGPANEGWRGTCARSPKTDQAPSQAPKRPKGNIYAIKSNG